MNQELQCVVPENIHTPHPPQMIIGNSEGEGGFEGSNFQGVGGGELLFQKVLNHLTNIERKSLDLEHKNIRRLF